MGRTWEGAETKGVAVKTPVMERRRVLYRRRHRSYSHYGLRPRRRRQHGEEASCTHRIGTVSGSVDEVSVNFIYPPTGTPNDSAEQRSVRVISCRGVWDVVCVHH